MTAIAVMSSELGTVLSDRRSVFWHAALTAFGPLILALLWPSENLYTYLADGEGPETLSMVGASMGMALALFSGATALDQIPARPGHAFVHWYRYTPAGPMTFLAGRLLFHLVHSFILVVMILPFLAVAAIPSEAKAGEVVVLAAWMLLFSVCLRAAAEGGRSTVKFNPSVAFMAYFLLFIAFAIAGYSSFRSWSAVAALVVLSEPARTDGTLIYRASVIMLLLALAGGITSWLRLRNAVRIEEAGGGS